MYSIYHFFAHLLRNRSLLLETKPLDEFPFDIELISCQNDGLFPDIAIKINPNNAELMGGELIELKDSQGYTVSSFNSTIPTGTKDIQKLISTTNSSMYRQMIASGDDVFTLPIRQVFYLVRGRSRGNTKVCLTHGSFFETVKAEDLVRQAFSQVLEERALESNLEISDEIKKVLVEIFSQQESFSRVRNVADASVKLRFRVMTEAKAEGNILNRVKYPEIEDNTLNFVLPLRIDDDETRIKSLVQIALAASELEQLNVFKIKHHLNGWYIVFQIPLIKNY
jgi:hypothetical protein